MPGRPRAEALVGLSALDVLMLRNGQTEGAGLAAGSVWEGGKPFYGTMVGPWWYHTATIVPRVRNLPFSVLRMLMRATRKPPQCDIKATPKRVDSQAVATPMRP